MRTTLTTTGTTDSISRQTARRAALAAVMLALARAGGQERLEARRAALLAAAPNTERLNQQGLDAVAGEAQARGALAASASARPASTMMISGCATPSFGAGTNPRSVAVGDFNRDGKPDLAAVILG